MQPDDVGGNMKQVLQVTKKTCVATVPMNPSCAYRSIHARYNYSGSTLVVAGRMSTLVSLSCSAL